MTDDRPIAQCEYCGIDFFVEGKGTGRGVQRMCKTAACKRDRRAESMARYIEKVPKKPGYVRITGKDPTEIGLNQFRRCKPTKGRGDGE